MAYDGLGWPMMAYDGLGWPRMASDGLGWPRMATLHFTPDARVRRLTQNIDSLENLAGLPAHMTVAAHGNFDRCSCIATGAAVPVEEVRAAIAHGKHGPEGWLAMAERHGGLVKPDIVFFGEQLPERFFELAESDFRQCDLLIILGTSLKVQPFASLVGLVDDDVPRLLINREKVDKLARMATDTHRWHLVAMDCVFLRWIACACMCLHVLACACMCLHVIACDCM